VKGENKRNHRWSAQNLPADNIQALLAMVMAMVMAMRGEARRCDAGGESGCRLLLHSGAKPKQT
jgi:hypothetical protein